MTKPVVNTPDKDINLYQLSQELGGVGLCSDATSITVADDVVTVSQTTLQNAVNAHVADPTFGQPVLPPSGNHLPKIDQDLRDTAIAVLTGTGVFSGPQLQKAVAEMILRA